MNQEKPKPLITREHVISVYRDLYKGQLRGSTPQEMIDNKLSQAETYSELLVQFGLQQHPEFAGRPALHIEEEIARAEDVNSIDVVLEILTELHERLIAHQATPIPTTPLPIVTIPPDTRLKALKNKSDAEIAKKYELQLQERLQILYETLLLLGLSQPDDFQLYEGQVAATMIRQTPYIIADIEALNRLVCICNEVGNRTFVFDREKIIEQFGENQYLENLANSTKNDLKTLIEQSAQDDTSGIIGAGFVWGKTAATKLAALLSGSKELSLKSLQSKEKQPKKELDADTIYLTPGPDGLAEYTKLDGTRVLIGNKHSIARKMGYTQASSKLNKLLVPISENIIFNITTGLVPKLYYFNPELKRIPDHVETILQGDENNIAQLELDGKTVHVGPLNAILKSFDLKISRTTSTDFNYAFLDSKIIMILKNGRIIEQLYVREKIAARALEKLRKHDVLATLEPETYDQIIEADTNGIGTITLEDGQIAHITSATNASQIKGYSGSYLSRTNKDLADASKLLIPGKKVGLRVKTGQIVTDIYILEKIPNKIDTDQIILQANQDGTAKIQDAEGKIITIGSKSTISKLAGYHHLHLSRNTSIAENARLSDPNIVLKNANHLITELYILERVPTRHHLTLIHPNEAGLGTTTFNHETIHLGPITTISENLGKNNTFIQNRPWLQQLCTYPDPSVALKTKTSVTTDLYVLEWAQAAMEKYGKNKKLIPHQIELDAEDLALIEWRKKQILG
jgi:hypothetical protein